MKPMNLDEALAERRAKKRILPLDEQDFRHGWNAALRAAEAIVAAKYDPCEPRLEPGDLTRMLEAEVET